MTRINCVPPEELSRPHLIAEYRELPRVFGLARRSVEVGASPPRIERYTMGAGHVLFFYTKLTYLRRRHKAVCDEMIARGYKPTIDVSREGLDLPAEWQQDWEPDDEALVVSRARIAERLAGKGVES